jgi:hypothetical protein
MVVDCLLLTPAGGRTITFTRRAVSICEIGRGVLAGTGQEAGRIAQGGTMSESQLEAAAVPAGEAVPVDTGNYPMPDNGPQNDLEQTTAPQYDEDLVDGAGFGVEE